MYQYRPIEEAEVGDIVERISTQAGAKLPMGLYFLKSVTNVFNLIDDIGSREKRHFKLLKTKPGSEAKMGDEVILISDDESYTECDFKIGDTNTVDEIEDNYVNGKGFHWEAKDVLVLCKAQAPETFAPPSIKETSKTIPVKDYNKPTKETKMKTKYQVGDVLHVPAFSYKDNLVTVTDITNIAYNYKDSAGHTGNAGLNWLENRNEVSLHSSNTTPKLKEETMPQETPITVTMTSKEYAKHTKAHGAVTTPKTQLEAAAKYHTQWFNTRGNKEDVTTQSPKKAQAELASNPSRIGYTYRTYKICASESTDIPTKNVLKETK